jgi:hypothetical protein
MHARELAELAVFVASVGPARIAMRKPLNDASLIEYWSASRCRYDRWMRALVAGGDDARPDVIQRLAVIEEVLASEVLTRIWTAVGCACDVALNVDEAGPILMNVWSAHLHARSRVLAFLMSGSGIGLERLSTINRTRRLCERWADLLLGQLSSYCHVGRFSHSLRRVHTFTEDARSSPDSERMWSTLNSSLRISLRTSLVQSAANPDLNRQTACAVLAGLPGDAFDSFGLAKSVWLTRMEKTSDDAQCLVDDLLSAERDEDLGATRNRLLRRPR